jgi:chromosome segregation ATPase
MLTTTMKNRIGIIVLVLVLVCVGLGIALMAVKKQAGEQQREYATATSALSNDLEKATIKLKDNEKVITTLYVDRDAQAKKLSALTNSYAEALTTLNQVSNNLVKTELALKDSQAETAKRDVKIAELESQNQALDKKAVDLSTAITNLTQQIEETKHKLATSEGEKGFLEKELKRLMAEKSELERQFNDLTVLRAQVSKLKEEISVARRLEWIRQGLFASSDQRGAQKLMQGVNSAQTKASKTSYDLNVEVSSDGSVRVIPGLTNRPAGANPVPK